jgi:hypothetical protein
VEKFVEEEIDEEELLEERIKIDVNGDDGLTKYTMAALELLRNIKGVEETAIWFHAIGMITGSVQRIFNTRMEHRTTLQDYLKSFPEKKEDILKVKNDFDEKFLKTTSSDPETLYIEEQKLYEIDEDRLNKKWKDLNPAEQKSHLRHYLFNRITYGYGLQRYYWTRDDKGFKLLMMDLTKSGYLLARGFFGQKFYNEEAQFQNETIYEKKVYSWNPKSRLKEEDKKKIQ